MFNECLFYLCDCTCSNVMCVCSTYVDQIKKIFVLFVCFWKWFVSPMFFKVFQIVCVWKTCYLGVFVTYFMCMFNHKLKGPILKFFSFGQRVSQLFCDYFASNPYPRKFPTSCKNYQISFLKGISWDICFKLLPSSPKSLF